MLKNMKLGKRLITAFIIVALIAGVSGFFGIYLFIKTATDYDYALYNYGFASGKVGMLSAEINVNRSHIRDIVFQTEKAQIDEAYNKIQESIKAIDNLLEEIRVTNTSDASKALFADIEAELVDYRTSRDKVMELGMANHQDEAYALLMAEAAPKLNKISEDINKLYQMNLDAGMQVTVDLRNFGSLMLGIMLACIVVGYIIAFIFALFISRGIARPVAKINLAAKRMAEGDYDTEIKYTSRDEVGSLADSMRTMMSTTKDIIMDTSRGLTEVSNGNFDIAPTMDYIGVFKGIEDSLVKIIVGLSRTMSQIKDSSDQVASGSEQVAGGAQALAQGATEQASSVEELSASIAEVSQQIRDNATHAATASNVANSVGGSIRTSNDQMVQMMSAMSEISSSSAQISKIIKTIEDIAFQTNILALNAAVEAARAGAAGKGFAVVADEVRNLATKSSEAAKQTNALIEGSVRSVEKGVKIADETAKSLAEVVTGAREITDLIAKISRASSEQSGAIAQINTGVEQISMVVQTNSATSEESAAASEELNGQANMMKQMIAKFKLKNIDTETVEVEAVPAAPTKHTPGKPVTASKY